MSVARDKVMKLFSLSKSIFCSSRFVREQCTDVSVTWEEARPYEEIPHPRGLPLLKNLLDLVSRRNKENYVEYHKSLIQKLGPIYRFRTPGSKGDILIVSSSKDSRTLLSHDGLMPRVSFFEPFERMRKGPLKEEMKITGLVAQGEEWLHFRQAVQQDMMRPKSALFYIDDLSNVMDEVIEKMITKMDKNNIVPDVNHLMQEFALEAIGHMFIGTKLGVVQGSEEGELMIKTTVRMFELITLAIVIPENIFSYLPHNKELIECSRTLAQICKKHIIKAIEKHEKDGSLNGTIIHKLIKNNGKESYIPIVMAIDALIAGIDTTGNTSTFLLYHLATNPDKQEKLNQEILKHVGKDGKMTEALLNEMRYLKACQQESQRMIPVANGTGRTTQVDMVLSGYQIPKGTFAMRNGVISSNDENYFHNADKFIPERWIRGNPEFTKVDSFANLPFGHGPRACVGQRFARLEVYMMAFKILQKFRLEYHGPPIKPFYSGLGRPNTEVKLVMVPR